MMNHQGRRYIKIQLAAAAVLCLLLAGIVLSGCARISALELPYPSQDLNSKPNTITELGANRPQKSAAQTVLLDYSSAEKPSEVLLNVPIVSQFPDYPSGCEMAAITMLLQYNGINITMNEVVAEIPYSDDPNQGFVGDPTVDGWTIYPEPMMAYLEQYISETVDLTDANLGTIKNYLDLGHPIICWILVPGLEDYFGDLPHCVLLVGYDTDNIYYNDPYTGELTGKDFDTFMSYHYSYDEMAVSYN